MSFLTRAEKRAGVFSLVVIVGLLLAACGGATPAPTPAAAAAPAATATAMPATEAPATTAPATVAPTETAEPTATLEPTDTPEPTPTDAPVAAAPADAANCVACHTSEETLQKLAVEDEPAESLSEGEG